MKAIKGLLIYIGIVLAIILGICILLFGIMYFIPSFRIFGVGVIHENDVKNEETIVLAEYAGFDDIEFNLSSKTININVIPDTEVADIKYALKLSAFGISFDITEYRVVRTVDVEDSTLKVNLNVTEPNGWISNNASYLTIYVPANYSYNILSKTNSGNLTLGGDKAYFDIDNLTINTDRGNLNVANVGSEGVWNLNSLNLTSNFAKMNFVSINEINVANKVLINSNNGRFQFNTLNADMDVRGAGVELVAKNIVCSASGFVFMTENGGLTVENLKSTGGAGNTIVTENCNISITNLYGNSGIITTYGDINLGTVYDEIILETDEGQINVSEAMKYIRANSRMGNINVAKYHQSGLFVNERGEIKVESVSEYNKDYSTIIETYDGNVNLVNKVNLINVKVTGEARADIRFIDIKNGLTEETTFQHQITTGSEGSASVLINPSKSGIYFRFYAEGNISGEISGLTLDYAGNEVQTSNEYQYFPDRTQGESKWWECCSFKFIGNIAIHSYTA